VKCSICGRVSQSALTLIYSVCRPWSHMHQKHTSSNASTFENNYLKVKLIKFNKLCKFIINFLIYSNIPQSEGDILVIF